MVAAVVWVHGGTVVVEKGFDTVPSHCQGDTRGGGRGSGTETECRSGNRLLWRRWT